jgi:GNAT superfamily N-acetyltransferase
MTHLHGMTEDARIEVRLVRPDDRQQWEALWIAYHAHGPFGGAPPGTRITEKTWRRFLAADDPVKALVAEHGGRLVGMIQMVFHPVTSLEEPVCFLNDLFVASDMRRRGVGRQLIEALYAEAGSRGARHVYWHMQIDNAAAKRLYDQVARPSGHTVYRKKLKIVNAAV